MGAILKIWPPSYNLDVWNPYYTDYITMHYFSSQGWAGWTATVGQLSDFQDELRNVYGYENVVIIAIGQSNISSFNSNFCAGQDLPLVMDQYPSLPVREMFSPYGQHKQLVILDYEVKVDFLHFGSVNFFFLQKERYYIA